MVSQNNELEKCKINIIGTNVSDESLLQSYDSDVLYFVLEGN